MRTQAQASRGNADFAAILTWLLPGAGHLYLGATGTAVAAFAVVQGLYWLGIQLSDGMLFEYLQADLRTPLAGALTPEAANLSALIYHMRTYGFGPPQPRPWPPGMDAGAWLTATSGMLNVVLMVHAHTLARLPRGKPLRGRSPAGLVLAAWLLPGLGHWLQGRRLRAVFVFAALVGLFALGTWLAQGSNLDRERHFYYWAGQFLVGLPLFACEWLNGHALVTGEIAYADGGLTIACVAGMLNVMAMLDVHGHAERRALDLPEAEPAPQQPPPGAAQRAAAGAIEPPQHGRLLR